ncbi:Ig-like domain-containing protein [Polaribacter ponticola]|uniref:Ig-like domain-containing protein n=1 Tax=Polaribacter ponticola TaxID=2978475 RepID=A0ABT5S828_9FLAO|nr:Ig-like domain-containing protein [Polaribacter sp. MSW5]MDD7913969.1 Ig-like domain-containing protein [Polaribacter sp. MSW5]
MLFFGTVKFYSTNNNFTKYLIESPQASTPTAEDDTINVDYESENNIISILLNDSYGTDGPISAHEPLTLVNGKQSTASLNGGLISVSDNGTINDKTDDFVLYSAPKGFSGTDSFTYSITDATGDAKTATVTITVLEEIALNSIDKIYSVSVDENCIDCVVDVKDLIISDFSTVGEISFISFYDDYNTHAGGSYSNEKQTDKGGIIKVNSGATYHYLDDLYTYTSPTNFTGTDKYFLYVYNTITKLSYVQINITVGTVTPPTNHTPTAEPDTVSVEFGSINNVIDVLDNDSFGSDGAINGGLTMTNGTLSSASANGGLISVDNKNTADTLDDKFIYAAPANFSGTDKFSYTITDATGDASIAEVTIIVAEETNNPKVVDDYYTIEENSGEFVFDVTTNDIKGNNSVDQIFVSIPNIYDQPFVNSQGTLALLDNNTPNDTSDDTLSFTPVQDFTGVYEFHYLYSVSDSGNSFTQVGYGYVYITVGSITPVADTPTAEDDTIIVDYESENNTISILLNDSYGSDGPTSIHEPLSLVNGKQSTATLKGGLISVSDNGTVNDKTDDRVIYDAPLGFTGIDSFTYSITDATGDAATAKVTITVTGLVVDVPSAVNDSAFVDENSTDNIIEILANDSFGTEGAYSPPMSFSAGLITQGFYIINSTSDEGGSITIVNNAVIYYTPFMNFTGVDRFRYYIYDASGDRSQGEVTVTVGAVTPPTNNTPTAEPDTVSVEFGSTNNIIDVLDNDSFGSDGAINGGLTMTNGTLSSASANGGLISVDNKNTADTLDDEFIYAAPANFSGTDTFSYTITDATGDASTGTVIVIVIPVEGAVNDTVTVTENSTDNLIDVLSNDNFGSGVGTLLLNSPNHLTGTTSQGGTLTLDDGGTVGINQADDKIFYTPKANFKGEDTFNYTLTVGVNQYQGIVTITVGNVTPPNNDELSAVDDNITINRNGTSLDQNPIFIDVLANDSFGPNGAMTAHRALSFRNGKSNEASEGGRIIRINDNDTPSDYSDDRVQYFPSGNPNFTSDSFSYTITDNVGVAVSAIVTITYEDATSQKSSIRLNNNKILMNNFLVFPNPSKGYLKTNILSKIDTKASISLSDITGKIIYKKSIELIEGLNEFNFNVNVLPGVLFLKIISPKINFGISKIIFK